MRERACRGRQNDYIDLESVCIGRESACRGIESHCRGVRGLAEAFRMII